MGLKENLTSWVVLRNLELRGMGGGGGREKIRTQYTNWSVIVGKETKHINLLLHILINQKFF